MYRRRRLVSAVAVVHGLVLIGLTNVPVTASNVPEANWTQTGFDAQHTGYNRFEMTLGRSNVAHLKRAFSSATRTGPDPIVVDGVAYLSRSASGYAQAINATTGGVKWTVNACAQGQQTSAPAFAMGRIWMGLNDPSIAGLDSRTGASFACPSPGDLFPAPPSAANGAVYAGGHSGELVAINAATGKVRWAIRPPSPLLDPSLDTPAVSLDGTNLFVGSSNGYVYKVDAGSGAIIWAHYVDSCGLSAVTVSESMLYVSGCNLYALSARTGALLWHSTHFGPTITAPAVANGLIIAGAQGNYAGLGAFNAITGKRVWLANEFVYAPPTVANGVVYVDEEFSLDMFNSSNGSRLGSVSTLPSGYQYEGSAIPVNGRVYISSFNYLNGTDTRLEAFKP